LTHPNSHKFSRRIPPTVDLQDFENVVKEWTKEEGLSYEFVYKVTKNAVTSLDRTLNPFWGIFEDACAEMKMDIVPEIFPAGTDSRYLRVLNIPVLGFSPMNNTKILLHDHNERLNRNVFLRGITIYEHLIQRLANALPS